MRICGYVNVIGGSEGNGDRVYRDIDGCGLWWFTCVDIGLCVPVCFHVMISMTQIQIFYQSKYTYKQTKTKNCNLRRRKSGGRGG